MPFVHVELLEGRTQEAKTALAQEIIEVVEKHTGAPQHKIHVIINEMKRDDYFHNPQV